MSNSPPELGSRALFPSLAPRAYLAHAAVSPLSLPVCDAIRGALGDYAARGVHAAIAQVATREALRQQLATLIHVEPSQIGLVPSLSVAATIVARSLPLAAGERVVVFAGEFPANVIPFKHAAEERGAELVQLPLTPFYRDRAEGLALLEAELRRSARLVAVSAVQFQTGFAMPIADMAALCHRYGAELFVDAIQAVGAVPFDAAALDVDYAAASGHKFLMGPEGTGFLYVHPRALARMGRGFGGWASVVDAFRFLSAGAGFLRYDAPCLPGAAFVEQGAQNTLGQAGLGASTRLLCALGVEAIFRHVSGYLDALEPALVERGFTSLRGRDPTARSASLCVVPPGGASLRALGDRLAEAGVATSTPDGNLRFAPHFPNCVDEIPFVLAALDAALRTSP